MKRALYWEKVTPEWWSCAAGYVRQAGAIWTAYVYRNLRHGTAWTEQKSGFASPGAARLWVESQAEE
jgi:hypothetical protein